MGGQCKMALAPQSVPGKRPQISPRPNLDEDPEAVGMHGLDGLSKCDRPYPLLVRHSPEIFDIRGEWLLRCTGVRRNYRRMLYPARQEISQRAHEQTRLPRVVRTGR